MQKVRLHFTHLVFGGPRLVVNHSSATLGAVDATFVCTILARAFFATGVVEGLTTTARHRVKVVTKESKTTRGILVIG